MNTGSGYVVTLTVYNPGDVTLNNVSLIAATLGTPGGTPLPQAMGTIASFGGSATTTVNFPLSAGTPGATVIGKFTVSSSSGNFSGNIKITLPS